MTYPSGGVVMLDAGMLLAATPSDLTALQARLQRAAEKTTSDGRPFRTRTAETAVGDVFVAPVSGRDAPHVVNVIRENGRARRVIIELEGPEGGGNLCVLTDGPDDAPRHAEPPTEPIDEPVLHLPPPALPDEDQPGRGPGVPLGAHAPSALQSA